MSLLFSATDDERTAFVKGFWRGLAAPALLYSRVALPDFMSGIKPVSIPKVSDSAALELDARLVSADLMNTLRKYGQAQPTTQAKRSRNRRRVSRR